MALTHELLEERRARQKNVGLIPQRNHMNEQNPVHPRSPSRAQQTLEKLSEPPTFREVAKHELKRATVWIPMLATTALGLMWLQRRVFLKGLSPIA